MTSVLRCPVCGRRFSHDLSPDSFNILGQKDFFSLFPIKFTYNKKEIHLMTAGIEHQD